MSDRYLHVKRGVFETIPLFIPAIPFALVFGVVVGESGLAPWLGWSSSPLMFGGAAQITIVSLLGEGASIAAAVTAALIVGARHLLYSVSIAPRFKGQPRWFRWLGPYVLIDQVFALVTLRQEEDPAAFRAYFLSAGFTFWGLWMVFTAAGLFVGPLIPVEWNIAFAAPVLFTALLVMAIDRWEKVAVALLSGAFTVMLSDLPNRSGLLVGAVIGILLGLLLESRRKRS
ncbi:AzlC family ABC transporter permease [Congregibacter variabilis]|uniref:AzlC family ABC transporter permease n=1 Tax=Congregibacter variabilis TaxID=3081200 RepID=A0ABZ0I2E1_9GAMM|nr:AzlC family ABC transporter permease [Congregibacter sp. IMCC43200]